MKGTSTTPNDVHAHGLTSDAVSSNQVDAMATLSSTDEQDSAFFGECFPLISEVASCEYVCGSTFEMVTNPIFLIRTMRSSCVSSWMYSSCLPGLRLGASSNIAFLGHITNALKSSGAHVPADRSELNKNNASILQISRPLNSGSLRPNSRQENESLNRLPPENEFVDLAQQFFSNTVSPS